jgi:multidrug efflux pump subunit AcrA (membrane-fusion protein)
VPVLYVVPEGQVVKKGDLLVELDNTALVRQLQDQQLRTAELKYQHVIASEAVSAAKDEFAGSLDLAEHALSLAKMALDAYVKGEYPSQLQEAEAARVSSEARLGYAEKRLRQAKASEDRKAERTAQAEFELHEAKATVAAAQSRLQLLKNSLYPYRKAELELAIARREFEVRRLQGQLKRDVRASEGQVNLARERLLMAEERLQWLQKYVRECKVHAPRAGRVLYVHRTQGRDGVAIPLEPGAVVHNGQPLVHLADAKRLQLQVRLDLTVAQRLKTGSKVAVHVDALPQQKFQGRITDLRVLPQWTTPAAEAMVTVLVDDAKAKLKPGMSATVEFAP